MLNLNVCYFQSFNEDLALNREGIRAPRAEDILPLVAFFVGFDWELDIYIPLMPLHFCDWCLMNRTNTEIVGRNIISRWQWAGDRQIWKEWGDRNLKERPVNLKGMQKEWGTELLSVFQTEKQQKPLSYWKPMVVPKWSHGFCRGWLLARECELCNSPPACPQLSMGAGLLFVPSSL